MTGSADKNGATESYKMGHPETEGVCLGILTVFLHQSERLRVPAVVDVGGLDVEVAVDAHRLLARV